MNSSNRIGELMPLLEKFEFPYCDGKHENVLRDATGKAVAGVGQSKELMPQCALSVRFKRPACGHCAGHEREPLSDMAYELQRAGKMTAELSALMRLHAADLKRKTSLDGDIRAARIGTALTIADVPSVEEAKLAAAPFVAEHRSIVDRMRILTAKLLEAART